MRVPQMLIPAPLGTGEDLPTLPHVLERSIAETRTMTSSNDFSYWNLRDSLVCQINALGAAYAHVGSAGRAEESLELAREELLRPAVYFLSDMPESYGIRVDNLLTILNLNLALLQMHGGSRVMAEHWLSLARRSLNKASEAGDRNPLLAPISDALSDAEDQAQTLRGWT